MSSKLNPKEAIELCGYPVNIKQNLFDFLVNTYGGQKHKLFLFTRNEKAPKIFMLQMQMPAKYNNQQYDITLLIYLPLNFPEIGPEIYFEKIGKVKINPNCSFYIDEDTLKINYSFFTWENSFKSFKDLIVELYNQFNIAFPVFSLNAKDESDNDNPDLGDCVFRKDLCKEIEFVKPIKVIQEIPNTIKNNPPFNENQEKRALIKLLQNNLSQKINYAIQPLTSSYMKLERIKEKINNKLKDYEKVESKENAIRQTINNLYKEMNFAITAPKEIENPDMSNLESVLLISNKDYYLRLAKEKAIEEYILIIKKSYEKQNIDFNTALNLIRTNSRNIFFLKYKNRNPFGAN
jgi:hypothetical protein